MGLRFCLVGLALLAATPSLALAQRPRIAVLPFSGTHGSVPRRRAVDVLSEGRRVRVIEVDRVDEVARGHAPEEARARAVDRLQADYVLSGEVRGRRRQARVELSLFDHRGREVDQRSVELSGGISAIAPILDVLANRARGRDEIGTDSRHHEARRDRRAMRDRARRQREQRTRRRERRHRRERQVDDDEGEEDWGGRPRHRSRDDDDDEDEGDDWGGRSQRRASRSDDDDWGRSGRASSRRRQAAERRRRAEREDDEEEAEDEEDDWESEDEDEDDDWGGRSDNDGLATSVRPLVEVRAGARIAGRFADFTMADGNTHRNHVPYPELTLDAEARPWRDVEGLENGLVLRGSFGHAVGLRTRHAITAEPIETTFFRVYVEGGMLFRPVDEVELGLTLGFGWDTFAFGEQLPIVLPSAEYPYIRPGLRGRFQLEQEMLVLDLNVGYRGVLSRGALSEHFGEEGESQAFDVYATLGGSLDLGLSYGVQAGFTGYFHFFSGDAVTSPALNGNDFNLYIGALVGFAIR